MTTHHKADLPMVAIPADEPAACIECARSIAVGWWGAAARHPAPPGTPACRLCLQGAATLTATQWMQYTANLVLDRERNGQRSTPHEDAIRLLPR